MYTVQSMWPRSIFCTCTNKAQYCFTYILHAVLRFFKISAWSFPSPFCLSLGTHHMKGARDIQEERRCWGGGGWRGEYSVSCQPYSGWHVRPYLYIHPHGCEATFTGCGPMSSYLAWWMPRNLTSLRHPYIVHKYAPHRILSSPILTYIQAQSRQSAKFFLQPSELGLPRPLTKRRVRGWESPNSDEGTYTVVLFIYTYFVHTSGHYSMYRICVLAP